MFSSLVLRHLCAEAMGGRRGRERDLGKRCMPAEIQDLLDELMPSVFSAHELEGV